MASNQSISSVDNPKVKAAAKLRESKHRRATGQFLIESPRDFKRVIDAGLRVKRLFLHAPLLSEDDRLGFYHEYGLSHHADDVHNVTEPVLRKLAYRENPTGLVAVVEQPDRSLDSIAWQEDSVVLIAQGLAKPGNLGAMARTAAAAGCAGMIIVDAVVDAFNPNAIRASTGAVFSLPIVCASSDDCRAMIEHENASVFAAALSDDAIDHTQVQYTSKTAIIIGPEDTGLSDDWLTFCQKRSSKDGSARGNVIRIPMADTSIDSLNASVATGVLLFEVMRQRRIDKK